MIGRPLDTTVQVVLEAQDDAGSLCLDADVFYADNKLDKSRVRITLEKSLTSPNQAVARIRSSVAVDEPVVTLYLRAGCQLKTERRYVLLAEPMPETAPDRNSPLPMPPLALGRPATVPVPEGASTEPVSRSTNANNAKSERAVRRSRSAAAAAPSNPDATTPAAGVSKAKSRRLTDSTEDSRTVLRNKARLKLEPLDLSIEREPQLKASTELLSVPATDPQSRATAIALWRALSAQPEDILRDAEKSQAQENSLRNLQAQSQKSMASINDLNGKLQEARSERYANVIVYTLLALLIAAVAGLLFLLRPSLFGRRGVSGDRPWWRKDGVYENQQAAWSNSSPSDDAGQMGINKGRSTPKVALVDSDDDSDAALKDIKPNSVKSVATPAFVDSVPLEKSDFGSSMMLPSRAVKAEELFDVQQQADFFVSIGQHDQAIEVLRSHIAENQETSALVYLDLFNLYHQSKKPAEYDNLRVMFNQRFNTQIPTFELYTDKYLGLESYNLAMSRIVALWPTPKVLEIIEESLFRQPDTKAEAFNLEAYRELLLLYSVANDIIGSAPSAGALSKKFDLPDRPFDSVHPLPVKFSSTSIQPLSASMEVTQPIEQVETVESLAALVVPPASLRLGLDIDLSKLSTPSRAVDFETPADAQFFAQFDLAAPALMPDTEPPSVVQPSGASDSDNLIDFETFEVPQPAPDKNKDRGV